MTTLENRFVMVYLSVCSDQIPDFHAFGMNQPRVRNRLSRPLTCSQARSLPNGTRCKLVHTMFGCIQVFLDCRTTFQARMTFVGRRLFP